MPGTGLRAMGAAEESDIRMPEGPGTIKLLTMWLPGVFAPCPEDRDAPGGPPGALTVTRTTPRDPPLPTVVRCGRIAGRSAASRTLPGAPPAAGVVAGQAAGSCVVRADRGWWWPVPAGVA